MIRNETYINNLKSSISVLEKKIKDLKSELEIQEALPPDGFVLIGVGEKVNVGAISFEPNHKVWSDAGNSVGKFINEKGYVDGITHSGYKYANPII